MPQLAANLSTMFCELPLLERFERAMSVGFRAAELQFVYDVPAEEIARAIRASRLELVLLNAPAGDLNSGERGLVLEDSSRFEETISLALDYARQMRCRRIHVFVGKQEKGLHGNSLHMAATRLRWAATKLAPYGIDLMLEALNPYDQPAYALPSLESAELLRQEIGMANVRLLFDVYHVQRSGGDPIGVLPRFLAATGHVQISSVPDRGEPETYETHAFFKALDAQGYGGFVGCEYNPRGETVAGLGWASPYGIGPNARLLSFSS